jgi:hypothetical protein
LRLLASDESTQLFDSVAPDVKVKQSGSSAFSNLAIAVAASRRGSSALVKTAVEAEALK